MNNSLEKRNLSYVSQSAFFSHAFKDCDPKHKYTNDHIKGRDKDLLT